MSCAALAWVLVAGNGCEIFADCEEARSCPVEVRESAEGGAGGVGGEREEVGPPSAPEPALDFETKALWFAWQAVEHAAVYRLERKRGEVWEELAETQEEHVEIALSLHLEDWSQMVFRVLACNASGCTPSSELDAKKAHLESIGYFKSAGGVTDYFGREIALDDAGKTLAVGFPHGVELFRRLAGEWTYWQTLDAPSMTAMALSGDGAVLATVRGTQTSTLEIYRWTDSAWNLRLSYTYPSTFRLLTSLALSEDGDVLAAGVPAGVSMAHTVSGRSEYGLVMIHSGILEEEGEVTLLGCPTSNLIRFGARVVLDAAGERLVIGAPGDDSNAVGVDGSVDNDEAVDTGGVFVYDLLDGEWSLASYLKPGAPASGAAFGSELALSDDGKTLAVGAPQASGIGVGLDANPASGGPASSGSVWVFREKEGNWKQDILIKSPAPTASAFFNVVSLSGDGSVLAVGAPGEKGADVGLLGDPSRTIAPANGAVHVYSSTEGEWRHVNYVKPPVIRSGTDFGKVALSGDGLTLAVGAVGEQGTGTGVYADPSELGTTATGAVFLY